MLSLKTKTWGLWILATVYLLFSTTLPPLAAEIYISESIRLFNLGFRPFIDFEWYYGVLPFVVCGWPMRLFGDALILQRLISVVIAIAILWQAHEFLKEQGIASWNRVLILALICIVSSSEQFSHTHTLVTLSVIVIARLLSREGLWRIQDQWCAIFFVIVAMTAKPLFGGATLAGLMPLLALWLGRVNVRQLPLLIFGSVVGTIFVGYLVIGQGWWLSNWYATLTGGRADRIFTNMQWWFLQLRLDYLGYFFTQGLSARTIQNYLAGPFLLFIYDIIILVCVLSLIRFHRLTFAFFLLTIGVSFQVIITGDISPLGYAQEVLPLCFLLLALVIRNISESVVRRWISPVLWMLLCAFVIRYGSSLYFESRNQMGTKGLAMLRLSPKYMEWNAVGNHLSKWNSAMSLGEYDLLLPTHQRGIPNYGVVFYGFMEETCFIDPVTDRKIIELLRSLKPEVLLLYVPAVEKASNSHSRSLAWIWLNYDAVDLGQKFPKQTILLSLKKLQKQGLTE
jgi:hypothetical protein